MIFFVIGTLLVLAFLVWASIQTALLLDRIPLSKNLLLSPAENVLRMVLIVVALVLGLSSGLPFQTLGWQAPGLVRDIAFGAVLGFGVALILPAITRVAIRLFGPQVYNPRLVMAIIPRTLREWVLVPLVLLPAVFLEELIFRSYLVGGFGILVSTIALAIAAPILFGVVHSAQGPLGIVAAAGLGFLLTGLFMVTSSLVAPFVAHYVINLTQLVWAVRDRDFRETIRRLSSQNANSGSHL